MTTHNTPSYSFNLLQNKKFPSKEKKACDQVLGKGTGIM